MANALHLHFNEWPFVDSSGENKLITNSGVTITASAGVFDGSDYLQIDKSNSLIPVNNENWEIDLIVEHSSVAGTQTYYSQYEDASNYSYLSNINGTGLQFVFVYGGETLVSLTGTEISDTASEHHIALIKNGDDFKLFLDGIEEDTDVYAFSSELIDSDIFIGQDGNSANYLSAAVRNIRISNISRWVTDFTANFDYDIATDDSTQLLLTLMTSATDGAEAGHSIWNPSQATRGNVDTGVRIFKFGDQCGFFPGSQDGLDPYALEIPDHPNWYMADEDFTLESWSYPLSHFNYSGILHQNQRIYWYIDSAGKLNWYVEDGGDSFSMQSSGTVPTDEWSHLAMTRNRELVDIVGPTLDPNAKSVNIDLSNGNLTGTFPGSGPSPWATVFSTDILTTGSKWYWEVRCDTKGFDQLFGASELNTNFTRFPDDATGYAYYSQSGQKYTNGVPTAYGDSWTSTDVIGIALDLVNGKIWFAKNGTWQAGGDPAAGTGEAFSINIQPHYPGVAIYTGGGGTSSIATFRPDPSSQTYSAPTGFQTIEFGGLQQTWRMYIKGIRQAQTGEDFTIPDLTGVLYIGRGTGDTDLYHGYLDELRLFIGKALFTDNQFWPSDYQYFNEPITRYYKRVLRRRIASIQGRAR